MDKFDIVQAERQAKIELAQDYAATLTDEQRRLTYQMTVQAREEAFHSGLNVFGEYRLEVSPNTSRRQESAINVFREFMKESYGIPMTEDFDYFNNSALWVGVTSDVVKQFVRWMLWVRGYAVGTVKSRLGTIKTYVGLCADEGIIPADMGTLVKGITVVKAKRKDKRALKNLDLNRAAAGVNTRYGAKKAANTVISNTQAQSLKNIPGDKPADYRLRLIMALLLNQGLRASEIIDLQFSDIEETSTSFVMTFYRRKTDTHTTLKLDAESAKAYMEYCKNVCPDCTGPLIRGIDRRGRVTEEAIKPSTLDYIVRNAGAKVGIVSFSCHDCRHYSVMFDVRRSMTSPELMRKYGWESVTTPNHYIKFHKDSEVAE